MRNYGLIASLSGRHQIHLLSFLAPGDDLDGAQPLWQACVALGAVPQPVRDWRQRLWTLVASSLPDMAHRLYSPAFQHLLRETIQEHDFDVVQFEGIEMLPYLPTVLEHCERRADPPKLVFDDHNAEYVLQRRVFAMDIRHIRRWPAALYSFVQWQKLRRYEAQACRQVDAVVAVSAPDARALEHLVPGRTVSVVPNGIPMADYQDAVSSEPVLPSHSLVFTGKMDYRPNVDAALWFAQRVFPIVQTFVPDALFYIVGQRPHARLNVLSGQSGVVITGRVPDTRPYIAGAEVYVIPLRSGGGTRFKVLEAMALRCPIVSTSMGCDGFPVAAGEEVLLADDAPSFADRVVALIQDPDRRKALGEAGFGFAGRYDWSRIVPRLEALYGDADTVR